jgi:hypothetical protein
MSEIDSNSVLAPQVSASISDVLAHLTEFRREVKHKLEMLEADIAAIKRNQEYLNDRQDISDIYLRASIGSSDRLPFGSARVPAANSSTRDRGDRRFAGLFD